MCSLQFISCFMVCVQSGSHAQKSLSGIRHHSRVLSGSNFQDLTSISYLYVDYLSPRCLYTPHFSPGGRLVVASSIEPSILPVMFKIPWIVSHSQWYRFILVKKPLGGQSAELHLECLPPRGWALVSALQTQVSEAESPPGLKFTAQKKDPKRKICPKDRASGLERQLRAKERRLLLQKIRVWFPAPM